MSCGGEDAACPTCGFALGIHLNPCPVDELAQRRKVKSPEPEAMEKEEALKLLEDYLQSVRSGELTITGVAVEKGYEPKDDEDGRRWFRSNGRRTLTIMFREPPGEWE